MTDVREKLLAFGSEPAPASPEQITRRLIEATDQFGHIVKERRINDNNGQEAWDCFGRAAKLAFFCWRP